MRMKSRCSPIVAAIAAGWLTLACGSDEGSPDGERIEPGIQPGTSIALADGRLEGRSEAGARHFFGIPARPKPRSTEM